MAGSAGGNANELEDEPDFRWRGREEAAVYFGAVVSLTCLGVVLRSLILNWIVGPLYVVAFVWAAVAVLGRQRGRRP